MPDGFSMRQRAIGGFLPLDCEPCGGQTDVLSLWGVTGDNAWMFANARSALARLSRQLAGKRLVLPAYICPELAAVGDDRLQIAFYPLSEDLSPDIAALATIIRSGDCVLAVDYFGRPPNHGFQEFVSARTDVSWVEDRAQALDPGQAPWGDWVLYSPRKLLGVPDGGILVCAGGAVPPACYAKSSGPDRAGPRAMRRDDPEERDSETWYANYRVIEAEMGVSCEPMSVRSRARLSEIDVEWVIARRRANFSALAMCLSDVALFPEVEPKFTPLGFPVRVTGRDRVWHRLCEGRVFPARYWQHLPSESAIFPAEHALSRELLVLPCDQRYDESDMAQMVEMFREAVL